MLYCIIILYSRSSIRQGVVNMVINKDTGFAADTTEGGEVIYSPDEIQSASGTAMLGLVN